MKPKPPLKAMPSEGSLFAKAQAAPAKVKNQPSTGKTRRVPSTESAPAKSAKAHTKQSGVRNIELPPERPTYAFFHSLPAPKDKTVDDWRYYVAVTCEYFHGCGIEKSYFDKLNMKPFDLVEGTEYEYCEAVLQFGFRKKGITPDIKFGDEAPEGRKSKRVDAAYVWSSLF